MSHFSRLARVIAAGALAISAVAVLSVDPAGAADTAANEDCSVGGVQTFSVANSDTVTVTITAGDCLSARLDVNGTSATATLNSSAMVDGLPASVATNDVIVITAPASGQGTVRIYFSDVSANVPVVMVDFGFPPLVASLTDDGNGSMTVTYSGNGIASHNNLTVMLYPAGHTCVVDDATEPLYVLDPDLPMAPLAASPAIVTAGTLAAVFAQGPPAAEAIAAGSYQACLMLYVGNNSSIGQSMAITLGAVAPTTTTTTTGTDPVVPAFTG